MQQSSASPVTPALQRAFHVTRPPSRRLDGLWDNGWLCGTTVLAEVADPHQATLVAQIIADTHPRGVRLAQPVRATDGRVVAGGWKATTFHEGQPVGTLDRVVAAAVRLDEALATKPTEQHGRRVAAVASTPTPPAPTALSSNPQQVFSFADAIAWHEDPLSVLPDQLLDADSYQLITQLVTDLPPVTGENQIVHGDMLHTTLATGDGQLIVTTLHPLWHPFGTTAALAIVDGWIAGNPDPAILERFDHIVDLKNLVVRSFVYRLLLAVLHPAATESYRELVFSVGRRLGTSSFGIVEA